MPYRIKFPFFNITILLKIKLCQLKCYRNHYVIKHPDRFLEYSLYNELHFNKGIHSCKCAFQCVQHTCFLFLSATCCKCFDMSNKQILNTTFIRLNTQSTRGDISTRIPFKFTNSIGHNLILKSRPGRYTLHTNKYPHYVHSMWLQPIPPLLERCLKSWIVWYAFKSYNLKKDLAYTKGVCARTYV